MSQEAAAPRPPGRGGLRFGTRIIAGPITPHRERLAHSAHELGAWVILALTLLVIALSPTLSPVPWFKALYDQKRAAELAVIVVSLVVFVARPTACRAIPKAAGFGVLALAALGAVSALVSASPRHAVMEVALFAGLFILTLNLASSFRKCAHRALLLTWYMLALGTLLLLVEFLAGCAGALVQGRALSAHEIVPGFSNIRFLNQVQTWTIPLLALGLCALPRLPGPLVATGYFVLGGSWMILLATGARGSVLSLILASALSALAFGRRARSFAKIQLLGATGGILAYLLVFQLAPLLAGINESLVPELGRTVDSGRLALWKLASTLVAENPLLGVGPQHFAWYTNPFSLAHPHNAALQIASEWGLPAILIVAWLALWGFLKWTTSVNSWAPGLPQAGQRVALWVSLVAGASHSLLTGILVMPLSQLLLALVCGALMGTCRPRKAGAPAATLRSSMPTRLLATLALVALVASVAPDLLIRLSGEEPSPQGMEVLGPRFWQLGGIPH